MSLLVEILKKEAFKADINKRVVTISDEGIKSTYFKAPYIKAFGGDAYDIYGNIDKLVNANIPEDITLKDTLINAIENAKAFYDLSSVDYNLSLNNLINYLVSEGYLIEIVYSPELDQYEIN